MYRVAQIKDNLQLTLNYWRENEFFTKNFENYRN